MCRALGIPCRVVSNLVSAHDANASLTIDRYYTADMEMMDYDPTNPDGDDSIWNYHVWNDVWMARPDLPKGYGGWQAIDATPQETSDGENHCVRFEGLTMVLNKAAALRVVISRCYEDMY